MDETTFDTLIASLNDAPVGSAVEMMIPRMTVVAAEGEGHPGSDGFRQGIRDLWRVAYAIQQLPKTDHAPAGFAPYTMPPTEVVFERADRNCLWRMFFPQPDFVTQEVLDQVLEDLRSKDKELKGDVFLAVHEPQRVVQTMHVGFPAGLPDSIAVITRYVEAHGLTIVGHHHETFIDDPIRIGFETARDLIRYAVASSPNPDLAKS